MLKASDQRVSPLTAEQHIEIIEAALRDFNMSPYLVAWHYLHAAFKSLGCNISVTARTVGLERRTVQRVLDQRRIGQAKRRG